MLIELEQPGPFALRAASPVGASPHKYRLPTASPLPESATTDSIAVERIFEPTLAPNARVPEIPALDPGSILQSATAPRFATTTAETARHSPPVAAPRARSSSTPTPSRSNPRRTLSDFESRTEAFHPPERQ